jgi:hypothetical protein
MRGSDPVSRLGLIAGCGSLPAEAARALRGAGTTVCAIAFEGLTDPALVGDVDELRWHKLGQLEATAASLRAMAMQSILLVGSISKQVLFDGSGRVEPDRAAVTLLEKLAGWRDDALFAALADWFEGQGFAIGRQDVVLASLVAREGAFASRPPDASEQADLVAGRRALEALGAAGIGQCVVVKRGCVVAVEAVEGTDEAIRRAGQLAGPGATVVKGIRSGQDRRFDLPAIGPGTIAAMVEARASCLAVEAGVTLILEREATRARADRAGIACVAFAPERVGS